MNSMTYLCKRAVTLSAALLMTGCGQSIGTSDNSTLLSSPDNDGVTESFSSSSSVQESESDSLDSEAVPANAEVSKASEQDAPSEGTTTAHLICVGDNLIHDNIFNEAYTLGNGEYDFSSMYELVAPYIEKADVAIVNQESLVNDAYEAQSYPVFSTPTECGDALVELGFNVISMANNHVLDKGSTGLISSLDYWDSKDVVHYGAYRDEADSEDIRTLEINDITFAFLGYTEHTNGITLSNYEDGKVIYLADEETIERQIKAADEIADVVVVSCHYGTEVEHELNTQQQTLTPKLVEWGADLIIGTQSHCVSTCEYLDKPDGGQAFVYYGLGNFFHTMYDQHTAVGIMGDLDVTLDYETGEVSFENVKAIPIISHFEGDSYSSAWYNCKIYPYADYTDELFSLNYNAGVTRSVVEECLSYIPSEFLSIE
ncbi:MAG: CapA family protein [Ruminococcus sp.]|nr:CapA family protein [Ruminococcus sp.]